MRAPVKAVTTSGLPCWKCCMPKCGSPQSSRGSHQTFEPPPQMAHASRRRRRSSIFRPATVDRRCATSSLSVVDTLHCSLTEFLTGRNGRGASTARQACVTSLAALQHDRIDPLCSLRPLVPGLEFSPGKFAGFRTSIRRLFGLRPELVRAAEPGQIQLSVSAAAVP